MDRAGDDGETVTALRFDVPAVADELASWCSGEVARPVDDPTDITILVPAPDGPLPARLGDWIVLQGDGSYCPYPHEVFAASFEPRT